MFLSPEHVPAFEQARPLLKHAFPDSRVILLCKTPDRPASLARYRTVWEVLARRPGVAQRFDGPAAQTTAMLCYSSGTTGLPKGVMTSHMNMTAQVGFECFEWARRDSSDRQIQANNVSFTQLSPKDGVLCFLPFSHMYAACIALMLPMSMGAPVVILPRFDEIQFLGAIQKVSWQ
jgi:acyl-CoA synthetase (AMP-forming)/AMP-acid ligase II